MAYLGSFNSLSKLSLANGINGSGQVIGISDSPNSTTTEDGFFYSNGRLTDLGAENVPLGIDDSGQVLTMTGLYSNGQTTALGVPPGYSLFVAGAINSSGQIVGSAADSSGGGVAFLDSNGTWTDLMLLALPIAVIWGVAFLYSNGTWTDLNSLVQAGVPITLVNAIGISDNGQNIVAQGSDGHLYLLTPGPGKPPVSPPPLPPMNCTADVNDVVNAMQQSRIQQFPWLLTVFLAEGIQAGQDVLIPGDFTFSSDNPNNPTYQIPILYKLLVAQNGSETDALYSDFAEWMYWAYQATETGPTH